MPQAAALVSSQNHVEVPFIIVQIGNIKFGHCGKSHNWSELNTPFTVDYPNYMDGLNITKINGAVNTYVITMTYAITHQDDPNRLEKVFSSISSSRLVKISYGDWNSPAYIYKEEEAIITKLVTKVNMKQSSIQYVINCTSTALSVSSLTKSFPAKYAKPSDEIKRLLVDANIGLLNIFKGMKGKDLSVFIDGHDKNVMLEAKPSIGVLEYISYLVSCMVWDGDSGSDLKNSCYFWSVYDDISNQYGGAYFKVVRVPSNIASIPSYNTYEVDVGYPTDSNVMDFVINNDDSWSLLYNYSKEIELPQYSYRINDEGEIVKDPSALITTSKQTYTTNEETRNWWSKVTQFPITATLTLKGLLRPAMLTSYVKVNTYFYGRKHNSSGLYIITKQEDSINAQGYRTTLTLLRIGGGDALIQQAASGPETTTNRSLGVGGLKHAVTQTALY